MRPASHSGTGSLTGQRQATAAARDTPAAYRVLQPGGGSALLWMLAAAVAVVALGSAGALARSRR